MKLSRAQLQNLYDGAVINKHFALTYILLSAINLCDALPGDVEVTLRVEPIKKKTPNEKAAAFLDHLRDFEPDEVLPAD